MADIYISATALEDVFTSAETEKTSLPWIVFIKRLILKVYRRQTLPRCYTNTVHKLLVWSTIFEKMFSRVTAYLWNHTPDLCDRQLTWLMECSYLISSCILTLSRHVENTWLFGYTDLQKQCSAVKNAASYWFKLFWWFSVCRRHGRAAAPEVSPVSFQQWSTAGVLQGQVHVQSHKLRHNTRLIFFSQCLALPRLWQCYFLKALSDTSSISFLLSLKESRCVLDCPISSLQEERESGRTVFVMLLVYK